MANSIGTCTVICGGSDGATDKQRANYHDMYDYRYQPAFLLGIGRPDHDCCWASSITLEQPAFRMASKQIPRDYMGFADRLAKQCLAMAAA